MTELYLKKDTSDWHRVIFTSEGSGFRLTRENPYFTDSETYTLDVQLPADIIANRRFFGSIQRIDATKRNEKFKCRLVADSRLVMEGTARISQVTDQMIKVQLLGGNSELNFLSSESDTYIDEMNLGYKGNNWVDYKGDIIQNPINTIVAAVTTYDETNDNFLNRKTYFPETGKWYHNIGLGARNYVCVQPNLIYILRAVLYKSGYTLDRCDFDRSPWNRIFIASAKRLFKFSHALPHWKVSEFLKEICNLFNCTIRINSSTMTASLVSNLGIFTGENATVLTPVDEYTAEIEEAEDNKILSAGNIGYDMSGSPEHVYDVISDDVREVIPVRTYPSRGEAYSAFMSMSETECMRYLFECPDGSFIGMKFEGKDPVPLFTPIDFFGTLRRTADYDSGIKLKICPVALKYVEDALYYGAPSSKVGMSCVVPTLENPTGDDAGLDDETETATAQDIIEGNATIEKAEKEDRMQIFFLDTKDQESFVQSGSDKGKAVPLAMPFTDYHYLWEWSGIHSSWSMSLRQSTTDHYIGQFHNSADSSNTSASVNPVAKHTIRFVSHTIPDPTATFNIHGKLYACEKIEANVTPEGIGRLMTGYFYELL